ncbi:MAG: polyhydroxybutyrate depolymerase [Hyphomicrobiales bacterium]|nr:polyhydroxybutyrate depolymerase [Hyphomicrobiales bacterium]
MRFLAVLMLMMFAGPAMACGVDSDCQLGDRVYRVYVPGGDTGKARGAIVFAHGWRNSAAGTMSNTSLLKFADELDVVLVASQAIGTGWQLPNRPRERSNTGEIEFSYYDALIDEIVKRYNVERGRILMAGFSGGGMMTWNLACHRGKLFAGFAPISGTFWGPVPDSCPTTPVNLMHFHGTSDDMVPLQGRAIADSRQGDVYKTLAMLEKSGDFGEATPIPAEDLECEQRKNPEGGLLEFCLHSGGHIYKAAFLKRAWEAFGLDSAS